MRAAQGVSGLAPFWGKVWCMSVTFLVFSHQVDRHGPRHDVIGYRSPKCPLGHSVDFPRRGTSLVTHVTIVPWEGTRRCVSSPCLRPACLRLLRQQKLVTYSAGAIYTFGYLPMTSWATWTNRIGVVLHMLQVLVTQTAFPKVSTRTQRLVPSRGTMVIWVTRDGFFFSCDLLHLLLSDAMHS